MLEPQTLHEDTSDLNVEASNTEKKGQAMSCLSPEWLANGMEMFP
jgi:hypothetical protein